MNALDVVKEIELILQDDNDEKLERISEVIYYYEYHKHYNEDEV
jgi:hypothetical protein